MANITKKQNIINLNKQKYNKALATMIMWVMCSERSYPGQNNLSTRMLVDMGIQAVSNGLKNWFHFGFIVIDNS